MLESTIKAVLNSFEPIGLKDINDVKLMDRVDTKFSFNVDHLATFLKSLEADYNVLVIENNPISKYHSLYYDNEVLSAFNDHRRSRPNRFKVRFRKYVYSNIRGKKLCSAETTCSIAKAIPLLPLIKLGT